MTAASRSLLFFGIYSICAGLVFIIIPATLFSMANLATMHIGWSRVVGLLLLVIGSYDVFCAKENILPYIRASVYVRAGFATGAVLLVIVGEMRSSFLLFGALDAAGAAWTAIALRK
jgi:hypothetical protein